MKDALNRTVVFLHPDQNSKNIKWETIGTVVTELSQLYQVVKERQVDLVLVDENRTDMIRPVAVKIRRYNGLMEIWRMIKREIPGEPEPDYIDGIISLKLGHKEFLNKILNIIKKKELLAGYGIVGRSTRMKVIGDTIDRIAASDVSVLVVGPSGAGKELVANAIHDNSHRRGKPYVAINCGALAGGVLESELFGHEKGAFTGSVSKREGLFSKADGGTIFLDEIGETQPDMQVKLLRVLEDGTYYPVGSSTPRRVDVRVVAATNRDLIEAIREQEFREDLYFRIGVVKIILPPLMDRRGDIQPLLQHFWSKYPRMDYTDAALNLLMKYDWPGNVRQLKNFADLMTALKPNSLVEQEDVERFVEEQHTTARNLPVSTGRTVEEAGQELIYRAILQLGTEIRMLRDLITSHIPANNHTTLGGEEFSDEEIGGSIEDMERKLIRQVLLETDGNRREAAKKLGIGERTLYRKLSKYNLK